MNARLVAIVCLFAACAGAPNGGDFALGSSDDPVVTRAQALVVTNPCGASVPQGPTRVFSDGFSSGPVNDPAWPTAAGYDAEFNADWTTDGFTARPTNPTWSSADPLAPALPVTTGFVKFLPLCTTGDHSVSVSADVDTTAFTDAISDATLVVYFFDSAANVVSIQTSNALRGGNRRRLALYDATVPSTTQLIAVVPMSRLGPTEQQTVFIDNLEVTLGTGAFQVLGALTDGFSSDDGTGHATGWATYGGDWFLYAAGAESWLTLWNSSWNGSAALPVDTGATRPFALPVRRSGDVLSARLLSAATFKAPSSFSMLRVAFDAAPDAPVDSPRLQGTAYDTLEVRRARIPDAATSATITSVAYLGEGETSSLYVDNLAVTVERPQFTLTAAKTYSPTTWYDGEVDFGADVTVDLPAEIPIDTTSNPALSAPFNLAAGNSGNHWVTLTFTTAAGATVSCRYHGGSSVAHPSGAQLALARRYVLRSNSCSNGAVAGARLTAKHLLLRADNGDSWQPSTRVRATLTFSY